MRSTDEPGPAAIAGRFAAALVVLGGISCAPPGPSAPAEVEAQPGIEGVLSNGLVPDRHEQAIRRSSALAGELARTIEALGGVARARVHLSLEDRPLLSREPGTPAQAAILVVRDRAQGPEAATVRSLAAAAVPGLEPDQVQVFFSGPDRAALKTERIGPIEVVASSARTARICFALLLALLGATATALVVAGFKLRRRAKR